MMSAIKKIVLFFPLLAFIFSCQTKQVVKEQFIEKKDPLKTLVLDFKARKDRIGNLNIIVYDFTDIYGNSLPQGKIISERLATMLAESGDFTVKEEKYIKRTETEDGNVSENSALLKGTVSEINGAYEINARLINAGTGDIITGAITKMEKEKINLPGRDKPVIESKMDSMDDYEFEEQPKADETKEKAKWENKEENSSIEGWKIWPGWENKYGNYSLKDGKLIYSLEKLQADFLDYPEKPYYPALILARNIDGEKWKLDFKVNYHIGEYGSRAFLLGVRFDEENIRPNLFCSSLPQKFVWQRYVGSLENKFEFFKAPENQHFLIPSEAAYGRFERNGNKIKGFYSLDGKKYIEVFEAEIKDAPIQRICISGTSYIDSQSYAEYEYIKLNNEKLF